MDSGYINKSSKADQTHNQFLKKLASDYGALKKQKWVNNNSTLIQRAYVIDCKDLDRDPADIISRIYEYNKTSGRAPVLCIPVSGWNPGKKASALTVEYAQSFSLSNMTTTGSCPVDFILRAADSSHKIEVFKLDGEKYIPLPPEMVTSDGKYFARISAGVRITDADTELFEKYGLAFFPNNTTLHPAAVSGILINGCYGPDGKNGPISTKTVEMRVTDIFGNLLTLSANENPDLFRILRDCSMGTCFYLRDFMVEVERKFLMKQHHVVYKDVSELTLAIEKENPINQDHFITMYFPIENGLRVTTFARTNEKPIHEITKKEKDFDDFLNLMVTEAGEPLIELIANSSTLRPFFPLILKSAALKTYGCEKESFHVDWSARAMHIFGTYTDLPIYDINWLIQVESRDDAAKLECELLALSDKILKEEGVQKNFPVLNSFVRHTKGVADPSGERGIAPLMVDKESQSIIAFEFVTYTSLSKTYAFKRLVDEVIKYLKLNERKFTYHYAKHMPDDITSLTQLATNELAKKRLNNFQEAVIEMHGGVNNIPYSPFLTPEKKKFIGLLADEYKEEAKLLRSSKVRRLTSVQKKQALEKIIEIANEQNDPRLAKKANKKLIQFESASFESSKTDT